MAEIAVTLDGEAAIVAASTASLPDARDCMDPANFKGYLDFDRDPVKKIYSFWKLDQIEGTFALFRNEKKTDGTIEHHKIEPEHPEDVKKFYTKIKLIIVNAIKMDKFRGGAFAEKVKYTSPLNDILQFIYWSPLMTKEHRFYFKRVVLALFQDVVSKLKEPSLSLRIDAEFLQTYNDQIEHMEKYFECDKRDPAPLPVDISMEWQGELGNDFLTTWTKCLATSKPFQVARGVRGKYGLSFPGYCTTFSPNELFPTRAADKAAEMTNQNMVKDTTAMKNEDYFKALKSIAIRKGEIQMPKDPSPAGKLAPAIRTGNANRASVNASFGEEYRDRFPATGGENEPFEDGVEMKEILKGDPDELDGNDNNNGSMKSGNSGNSNKSKKGGKNAKGKGRK